jgi:glutamate dehydrogenase
VTDETGAEAPRIAKAFAATRDSYAMTVLNSEIDALDGRIGGDLQLSLYAAVQDLLLDRVNWFLRNVDLGRGLAEIVERYRGGIDEVSKALEKALPSEQHAARSARASEMIAARVPEALALRIASLPELTAAPDIVLVADQTRTQVQAVTATYFALVAYFRLDRIVAAARAIEVKDHFDRLALDRALSEIASSARALSAEALSLGTGTTGEAAVHAWVGRRGHEIERGRKTIHDIAGSGLTLSKLAVVVGLLADLSKT